jgi:hypothetical protein
MEWLNAIRCYRPYSEPEKTARWLIEIANADEAIDGRIHIEKIDAPFSVRIYGQPGQIPNWAQAGD